MTQPADAPKTRFRRAPRPVLRGIAVSAAALILVGIGGAYKTYHRDLEAARTRAASGSRIVDTRCGRIEYGTQGEGLPVLVVHGAGGGFDQGLQFAAPLARRGFQVIAMSRFGYLRTPLPADASARAQAAAHACLLDALHIQRASIIGASAGAPSSIQFAVHYPQRTTALILLVPATYVPRPGQEPSLRTPSGTGFLFNTALRSDFLFWLATHTARRQVVRAILATPPELVESASREDQDRIAAVLHSILPVSSRRLGLVNDAATTSAAERYDLELIRAPTLIIGTADDLFGTFDAARYTAGHIPGARLVGYPTGGHLWVGHQDDVLSELDDFLRQHH